MPGKEIKGRSKRANYSHGGRAGFAMGSMVSRMPKAIKRLGKKVPKKEDDKRPPQSSRPTPMAPRSKMKKGGRSGFPDHSGDGKITQKDILMAKGVIPKTKGKK